MNEKVDILKRRNLLAESDIVRAERNR